MERERERTQGENADGAITATTSQSMKHETRGKPNGLPIDSPNEQHATFVQSMMTPHIYVIHV